MKGETVAPGSGIDLEFETDGKIHFILISTFGVVDFWACKPEAGKPSIINK